MENPILPPGPRIRKVTGAFVVSGTKFNWMNSRLRTDRLGVQSPCPYPRSLTSLE